MTLTPGRDSPFYFPLQDGRYQVKPGLYTLSHNFGNAEQDACIFQLDKHFHHYRENKVTARQDRLDKYICSAASYQAPSRLISFIINTLVKDYPGYFFYDETSRELSCQLTGDKLRFTPGYELDKSNSKIKQQGGYLNAWDALAMQVQEDLAIMEIDSAGQGKLASVHLCAPNHWAPADKLGENFSKVHEPVPGMEQVSQRAKQLNLACLNKGPYVRFAWGLSTDRRLNHHPVPPADYPGNDWQGRAFNLQQPELYLRIERQTLSGFPRQGCILFTIRTFFLDVHQLSEQQQKLLYDAISSMNKEERVYKGLGSCGQEILDWLITQS